MSSFSMKVAQELCPLIARTAELEIVSRELARHFNQPGSRRGSTNGMGGGTNNNTKTNNGNGNGNMQQLGVVTPAQVVNHLSLKVRRKGKEDEKKHS